MHNISTLRSSSTSLTFIHLALSINSEPALPFPLSTTSFQTSSGIVIYSKSSCRMNSRFNFASAIKGSESETIII